MTSELRPAPREWLLLVVLSGIQFSQMVDFMVLMPLGTQLGTLSAESVPLAGVPTLNVRLALSTSEATSGR